MVDIKTTEMRVIEEAFGLGRENPKGAGFVLDFSDRTMPTWFREELGVDIDEARYKTQGSSKANRFRGFIKEEPALVVADMLRKLWEHRQAIKWQPEGGATADQVANMKTQLFAFIKRLEEPAARLTDAKAIAISFDATHMGDQIRRIESSIKTDPALAIGTAKELTETCFKTILSARGIPYDKEDLPQLGKKIFSALKLLPEDIPETAKGAKTIKVMLSNLATVVQGLAEIRSLYGTGHGRDGKTRGISPRHARLVVGAASTLVTFAFETHLETFPIKPNIGRRRHETEFKAR